MIRCFLRLTNLWECTQNEIGELRNAHIAYEAELLEVNLGLHISIVLLFWRTIEIPAEFHYLIHNNETLLELINFCVFHVKKPT